MKNYIEVDGGCIGFGETREEAKRDLYINKCKLSLSNDTNNEFKKRREELFPWQPKPNMLHLCGVGCLVYKKLHLTNTKTGKSVYIGQRGKTIYYYLAELVGDTLSYTDIAIVIRPELDNLFQYISKDFVLLNDYPSIQLMNATNGFDPHAVYQFQSGVLVGIMDKCVGIKFLGQSMYYVVDLEDNNSIIALISYIGYKLGVILTKDGVQTRVE